MSDREVSALLYNGHPLRHELKYMISYADYNAAVQVLSRVMEPDPHSKDGGYLIRSLYLDDMFQSAYREKEAGVERRRKHRVRIYGLSDSVIKYEVKDKFGPYISKSSSFITRAQCDMIAAGDMSFLSGADPHEQALMFGLIDSRTRLLRPKVIVDYYRKAFICGEGNVRVTFDSKLRAGIASYDIFDASVPTVPAIEEDRLILEVKFDDYLPDHIRALLRQFDAWQTSQSKYVMCVDAKNRFYRKDIPYVFI